jgi:hypothetical protein
VSAGNDLEILYCRNFIIGVVAATNQSYACHHLGVSFFLIPNPILGPHLSFWRVNQAHFAPRRLAHKLLIQPEVDRPNPLTSISLAGKFCRTLSVALGFGTSRTLHFNIPYPALLQCWLPMLVESKASYTYISTLRPTSCNSLCSLDQTSSFRQQAQRIPKRRTWINIYKKRQWPSLEPRRKI